MHLRITIQIPSNSKSTEWIGIQVIRKDCTSKRSTLLPRPQESDFRRKRSSVRSTNSSSEHITTAGEKLIKEHCLHCKSHKIVRDPPTNKAEFGMTTVCVYEHSVMMTPTDTRVLKIIMKNKSGLSGNTGFQY